MGDVIQFPTTRVSRSVPDEPHLLIAELTVVGAKNNVHVYPVEYFKNIVIGTPGMEPIPEPILRRILMEWLLNMGVIE